MAKFSRIALIIGVLCVARAARGECYTQDTAPADAGCVAMHYGDAAGAWLSVPTLDRLTAAAAIAPHAMAEADAAVALAGIRAEQAELSRRAAENAVKAAQAADADATAAKAELSAWYRSPWLWAAVGGLGGIILARELVR